FNPEASLFIAGVALGFNLIACVIGKMTKTGSAGFLKGFWIAAGATLLATLFCVWHRSAVGPTSDIWTTLLVPQDQPGGGTELAMVQMFAWLSWSCPTVPLLIAAGIGIMCIACRVPLSAGWVRGFRGLAVPVSCILCLMYAGIIVSTVRQESFSKYAL